MTDTLQTWWDALPYARRVSLLPALRAARRSQSMRSAFSDLIGTRCDQHAVDRTLMTEMTRQSALQLLYERGPAMPVRSDTIAALDKLVEDGLITKDLLGRYVPVSLNHRSTL